MTDDDDTADAQPHRIRLRDWEAISSASGDVLLRRHFHRPTNLLNCDVKVRIDGATPRSVVINDTPLPCDESTADCSKWQVNVEQLLPRNLIECTFGAAPPSVDVCLEIVSPEG